MSEPAGALETQEGDDRLAELSEEFLGRYRAGEHPSIEEYANKHPGLAERIRDLFPAVVLMEQPGATVDLGPTAERVGAIIGRYKLLERIGEGGFGVVFMAEQQQPIRRKVALKVIKPGVDTRQVIARFEAERQALALMDHENIAKVLDAGATDTGRPYFVMELVHGIPITEFCDKNELPPRERLALFMQVCHAVQHAHTKGIIHRDIKPTNVLVTLQEGVPVPKVIDFGIAKATGQQLTEKTLFTNFAQMVGTPLYMSPEQAEMTGVDVDTRSDVYSLGVLLYELLTGTTPLDKERLKQAAFDEVRRIIRDEEPPRPSTRLSTMGEQAKTVSAQRKSDPKQLGRLVRGELDWIVMKALEKQRARRYETANGLARDIERYLKDEPVEACPPSTAYRLRKLARRHRLAVMGTLALVTVLVALVAGLAVTNRIVTNSRNDVAAALRQKEQALAAAKGSAEHANVQRQRAEENLRKARYESAVREVSQQSLTTDFKKGEQRVRESIAILEELQRESPAQPEYRARVAWSHVILGRILLNSGRPDEAKTAVQLSVDLYNALLIQQPGVADHAHRAMIALGLMASLLREQGREDEAKQTLERAIAIYDQVNELAPAEVTVRRDVAQVFFVLGDRRIAAGRMQDAAGVYNRGLKLYPDFHWPWYQIAALYLWIGDVEHYRGVCREMLDRFEASAATNPQVAEITAKTCSLAPGSVPDFTRVERLAEKCVTLDLESHYFRHFILAKGLTEFRAGHHEQAVKWLERFDPQASGMHWDATAFAALAMAHHRLGHAEQARAFLESARAIIAKKPSDAMNGAYWFDWLHCEILCREAQQVLAK
jgi:serine/threonine protein kinase/tetratricopeptide (TPR) repeat protein